MAISTPDEPEAPGGSRVIQFPRPEQRRKATLLKAESPTPDSVKTASPEPTEPPHPSNPETALPDETPNAEAFSNPPQAAEPMLDGSGLPIEEFWNLPNTVTMLRTGVVPILVFLPLAQGPAGSRFMAWAFIVAALTDWLDGYLARRHGGRYVTRIGKLLDPLADKLIVSTALIMLLAIGRIPVWAAGMVVVIVGRELAVTGLRGIASTHGTVVAARGPGKIKTIAQSAATAALLFHYKTFGLPAHEIGMTLLAVATGLTLWSGYLYFADYFGWSGSEPSS